METNMASAKIKGAKAPRGGLAAFGLAALLLAGVAAPTLASAQEQPAFDTPVASQFQESWKVFLDMKAKANGGTKKSFADLPDWSGIWTRDFSGGLKFDPKQPGPPFGGPVVPNATAELTPEYRAKYIKKLEEFKKGNEWDPLSACLPAGYPRWLTEPFLREFIVRPEAVWWLTEQNAEIRRLYTDGRGHLPDDEGYPLWEGDSVAFWDGDTLVVHTINVKAGQYQRNQPDYSDQASTVERIRKVDADTIEDDVTVYDPPALTKPWHVVQRYTKVKAPPHVRIDHWSCAENNNVVKTDSGGSDFVLPGEKGYKDPSTINLPPTSQTAKKPVAKKKK